MYSNVHPAVANFVQILSSGKPILIGFKCFPSINLAQKDGVVPIPKKDEPHTSNHAVTVIGYSLEKQVFKFINSYGSDWGDNGCGYLPFYYLENGLVLEAFIMNVEER